MIWRGHRVSRTSWAAKIRKTAQLWHLSKYWWTIVQDGRLEKVVGGQTARIFDGLLDASFVDRRKGLWIQSEGTSLGSNSARLTASCAAIRLGQQPRVRSARCARGPRQQAAAIAQSVGSFHLAGRVERSVESLDRGVEAVGQLQVRAWRVLDLLGGLLETLLGHCGLQDWRDWRLEQDQNWRYDPYHWSK